jgi:hypothetical protein
MTNDQHGVAARIASRNKSAPDSSPSHGTPVEQPPEVCSPPAYVLTRIAGMALTSMRRTGATHLQV